ncbi:EAL domain-containing protein [Bacillus sp. 2205SS5-2]|uniref:EAL domain-containing protein n=1 Tax=Bacillus sp. 2205SS5-2 TaxID=3109031 RepID=UPI003FA5B845
MNCTIFCRIETRSLYAEWFSYVQPILGIDSQELYGYESLLRATGEKSISPFSLFQTANRLGLHSLLDKRARESAIKSRRGQMPTGVKSYIYFSPSTIFNPSFYLKHKFQVVKR